MRLPIKVGIAGLGRSGWNIHAATLASCPDYEIVAVADMAAERRSEAAGRFGCATYETPEELIAHSEVEVVVVATPSHTHAQLAVAALASGKHVVVEKPLAQSTAEVDSMIAAADQAERTLTCFHNRRLDPELLAIQDVIASGKIGDLVFIRRCISRFVRRSDWQTLRSMGGGVLSNTASHLLDQVLLLMGEGQVELFADLRQVASAGDAEDHVQLLLKMADGPTAEVFASFAFEARQPQWLISGTSGSISSADNVLTVRWFDPSSLADLEVERGMAPDRRYGTGEQIDWHEERIELQAPDNDRTQRYYELLAASVREDGELLVTPQSVRRQIHLIEEARCQAGFP